MLDISPSLLLVTFGVFLALIIILNAWLFKPLMSYMQKRDDDIKKSLNEVGSNSSDIDSFKNEAEKIVADAKHEAHAVREKVLSESRLLADSKLEAKRSELAKVYAEFEAQLQKDRDELKSALLSQAPLLKESLKAKFNQI